MNKSISILFVLILFLLACSTSEKQQNTITQTTATVAADTSVSKTIVFGTFCGECVKNCATMIQYSSVQSKEELRMDYSDGYFKRRESGFVFDSLINDKTKLKIAADVLHNFPKNVNADTYGCPDCTDGCGIYVQLNEGITSKKYYIDTDTSQIKNSEVKNFAVYVMNAISKIKK